MIGNLGCVGGGGGDILTAAPVRFDGAATGAVSQLTSNLMGTVTFSKVSGAANVTVASNGAVSIGTALGVDGSAGFVARAANGTGDAVEASVTLTGAPPTILPNFKAAVAAVRAGTSNAAIWLQGDSTTAGEGAGVVPGNGIGPNVFTNAYPYTVAHLLAADYTAQVGGAGCRAVEDGFVGSQLLNGTTYPGYDSRVGMGSWTASGGGGYIASTAAGAMFSMTFANACNQVNFAMRNTLVGAMDVYAADGTTLLGTISADTTSATTFQSLSVPAGTTGIKLSYKSGTPQVYLIQPINTLIKQMYIYKNGWPATTLSSVAGQSGLASPRNIIVNVRPSLVIIDSYINEATNPAVNTEAVYKASLQAFVDTAKAAGAEVLFVFGNWASATSANAPTYKGYMQDVATANNCPLFDLTSYSDFASFSVQTANGYMDGGSTHLSQSGYAAKEAHLRQFLGLS